MNSNVKDKLTQQLQQLEAKHIVMNQVLSAVCEATGISEYKIKSNDRTRPVSDARHAFFYLVTLSRDHSFTLSELGNFLNRDHATVLHSKRVTKDYMLTDKMFRRMVLKIGKTLPSINIPMSIDEKTKAMKLTTDRIDTLNEWLKTHPENPYRAKVQEDVRELENELKNLETSETIKTT